MVTLVLAYGAHLCEAGTLQEMNPADSTVKSYFLISAQAIYSLLKALPGGLEYFLSGSSDMWDSYDALVKQQSKGNQGTMRSALTNFHSFLVEWFDVSPLYRPLEIDSKVDQINPQMIWDHEVKLAACWADSHPDLHVGIPAKIMIQVASEVPVRTDELMRLRICHVHIYQDHRGAFAEIEIANDAHSGRLKTIRSQRVTTLRERSTIDLLIGWIEQRRSEGSPLNGYLFGDPTDDSVRYKPNAIQAWISKLLKAATGQPNARMHWLRHTVLSHQIEQTLRSSGWIDSNRFEIIAAQAGHSSPTTTILVYSHLYEKALRLWLNINLMENIELKSAVSARFLNISHDTLRARASRSKITSSKWAWHQIFQKSNIGASCSRLFLHTELSGASCPAHDSSPSRRLSPSVVIGLIEDVVSGVALETISHRYALPMTTLKQWDQELSASLWVFAENLYPRRMKKIVVSEGLGESFKAMDLDFSRVRQNKFDVFLNSLDTIGNDEAIRRGYESWKTSKYRNLISLANPVDMFDLLNLLKICAVNPDRLTVCLQTTDEKLAPSFAPTFKNLNNEKLTLMGVVIARNIRTVFLSVFNHQPTIKEVKFHPDRPSAYLRWNSRIDGGASGGSTAGLDALMVGLLGYLLLKEIAL
jgi:hypothetical protein